MISSELDIHSFKRQNNINFDFNRLTFYLSHVWIVKIFKALKLTHLLRLEVFVVNEKLKHRLSELVAFIVVIDSYKGAISDELTELIAYFNEDVNRYSYAHSELQKLLQTPYAKGLGDWDTTNTLITQIIEANYKLIRIFKKLNKKTPAPTTQLAKDTVRHSRSTLSKIVNGHSSKGCLLVALPPSMMVQESIRLLYYRLEKLMKLKILLLP